jgi:deoxyribonuclease V
MKLPRVPHAWRLSPRQAVAVQRRLASRVVVAPPDREMRRVAGLDAAFSVDGRRCLAVAVVWDRVGRRVTEVASASRPVRFPYVPGLLSFREAPALLAALRKLRQPVDVLLCDGQGLAHPRRFGIACHLGVLCDLPAVGCAKSRLVGEHAEPPLHTGGYAALTAKGEVLGAVVRTRARTRPVFVSVGHKLDLPSAVKLVLACVRNSRVPEPTRLADRLVAAWKRGGAPPGRGDSTGPPMDTNQHEAGRARQ